MAIRYNVLNELLILIRTWQNLCFLCLTSNNLESLGQSILNVKYTLHLTNFWEYHKFGDSINSVRIFLKKAGKSETSLFKTI